MRRVVLEARCQLFLARLDIDERRFEMAIARLDAIAPGTLRVLAPELRAQTHHWRSQALAGRGDRLASDAEAATAVRLIDQARRLLPEAYRDRVLLRPDIRFIHAEAGPRP